MSQNVPDERRALMTARITVTGPRAMDRKSMRTPRSETMAAAPVVATLPAGDKAAAWPVFVLAFGALADVLARCRECVRPMVPVLAACGSRARTCARACAHRSGTRPGRHRRERLMTVNPVGIVAALAIIGFIWSLSRDVRALHRCMERDLWALSDRVSRIEGQVSTMLGMLRRANGEDSDPAHVPERAGIDTGGGG